MFSNFAKMSKASMPMTPKINKIAAMKVKAKGMAKYAPAKLGMFSKGFGVYKAVTPKINKIAATKVKDKMPMLAQAKVAVGSTAAPLSTGSYSGNRIKKNVY